MRGMRFTTGLLAGAVIGGMLGMFFDPVKDKDARQMKKSAGSFIHSVGNAVEDMADQR